MSIIEDITFDNFSMPPQQTEAMNDHALTDTLGSSVADELLSNFAKVWVNVFALPIHGSALDTINQNSTTVTYFGDGESDDADLMDEFRANYDALMQGLYDGSDRSFDLAVAWFGKLRPESKPSVQAVVMLHPALNDRFADIAMGDLWRKLGWFGVFETAEEAKGPMARWHEAASSVVMSDPYLSTPGRKWFVMSTNPKTRALLGDLLT